MALGAGILIGIVPIAIRRAHYADTPRTRVASAIVAVLAAIAFCVYMVFLVRHFMPVTTENQEAPVSYPSTPTH